MVYSNQMVFAGFVPVHRKHEYPLKDLSLDDFVFLGTEHSDTTSGMGDHDKILFVFRQVLLQERFAEKRNFVSFHCSKKFWIIRLLFLKYPSTPPSLFCIEVNPP